MAPKNDPEQDRFSLRQLYSSHFSELDEENEVWSWDFPIELLKQLETKLAEPVASGQRR